MTEATVKAGLVRAIKAEMGGCVVFRHEDVFTAGVPDISVTWHRRTLWVEVKLGRGRLSGAQNLALMRLGRQSMAVCVNYREDGVANIQSFTSWLETDDVHSVPPGLDGHVAVARRLRAIILCCL